MTTVSTESRSQFRAWLGVAAITASLFVFVTTELMPVGLLTPVSAGLSVSVSLAGMMVTLYGISAGVGVPFLVAWSRTVNRRALLGTLLAIMARMAAYTGQLVTWEQALKSKEDLTPPRYDWDVQLPEPPVAVPGKTKLT